jgi:HD-GYP domain-containing protein (c-di-GMP phosphodiesterase class II)
MIKKEYIKARNSQLKFYRHVELYTHVPGEGYVLYKQTGTTLSDLRINRGTHPENLYIRRKDKLKGLQEAQKGFNKELETYINSENPSKVKDTVVSVVSETLTEPRSGSLEGVTDTVDILISDYVRESDVLSHLIDMSYTDYSTTLHSINVMAFALVFAFHMNYSREQTKKLGLCALLHDVGKTKINPNILAAPRKLTDEEFEEVKAHTTLGFGILSQCKFIHNEVRLAALEHHEKLDGSGYPQGKTNFCETSQIVGMIDCYEALTNDERPYRVAMPPFDTLDTIIGIEVTAGKFNKEMYRNFVQSLGDMSQKNDPIATLKSTKALRPSLSHTHRYDPVKLP